MYMDTLRDYRMTRDEGKAKDMITEEILEEGNEERLSEQCDDNGEEYDNDFEPLQEGELAEAKAGDGVALSEEKQRADSEAVHRLQQGVGAETAATDSGGVADVSSDDYLFDPEVGGVCTEEPVLRFADELV